MPVYEFVCATCGPFEQWRPLEEATDPMRCPTCQTIAQRVYSVPGFFKTPRALTAALDRANKSAYEPEVIRQEPPAPSEA